MARLKDRTRQIPNGLKFKDPATGWDSEKVLGLHPSFNTLVNAVIVARRGNAWLTQQKGLATDTPTVSAEVDRYNAAICEKYGWHSFITGGSAEAPPPKAVSPSPNVAAGAESLMRGAATIVDWISSGAEAVSGELAEQRAAVCVTCLHNSSKAFGSFFTAPLSAAIAKAIQKRGEFKLKTSHDDKLGICDVCLCPLKLKIHLDHASIMKRIGKKTYDELPAWCWIVKEGK